MLDHQIYAVMYGTDRGTAPVSLWGSAWYNFGWAGITVLPYFLALLYQGVYARFVRKRKTLFRTLIYSGLTVVLGLWAVGGPLTLANTGLLAIILLDLLVRVWLGLCRRVLGTDDERWRFTQRATGGQL